MSGSLIIDLVVGEGEGPPPPSRPIVVVEPKAPRLRGVLAVVTILPPGEPKSWWFSLLAEDEDVAFVFCCRVVAAAFVSDVFLSIVVAFLSSLS